MNKKDISKILTTGSPKQRIMIVAEDRARQRFQFSEPTLKKEYNTPILTEHEFRQLSDSFKTSNEIALWNKWLNVDRTVLTAISNLQGLMFEVKMHYSNLRGYILVWNSIENTELLVNSVLHEIKDPKERKRIAENGAKGIDLLFSKTEPDQDGYIEIKVDFEQNSYRDENGNFIKYKDLKKPRKTKEASLWYVMNNVKQEAITTAVRFLSWKEAILDYMEEEGFIIRPYKALIERLTEEIYKPIIGWEKYQSDEKNFRPKSPHERLDKLKNKYAITPSRKELIVDREIYNWYKANLLKNE
jgi:hypothetical protein